MTHRLLLLPAVCALALSVAACDGGGVRVSSTTTVDDGEGKGALKVVDTLQCPDRQGQLTRKGTATNGGTVCTYVGPRGAMVTLHLVALDGNTPAQMLKSFEDSLSTSMPQAVSQLSAATARADAEAARADAEAARAEQGGDQASVRMPGVSVDAKGDQASVRMPGIRIEADGDKATVDIAGIKIDADDTNASVNIDGGEDGENVSIQAHNDAAEIRSDSPGAATRSRWILTDSRGSAEGWRVVGYEARGPIGGPIVVATVRSKDRNHDRAFEDARALVALNVGE
jgi:hypothetical protein